MDLNLLGREIGGSVDASGESSIACFSFINLHRVDERSVIGATLTFDKALQVSKSHHDRYMLTSL